MEKQLALPDTVVSKTDLLRMLREVESVDDFFVQAKLRSSGSAMQPPRSSQQLEELAKSNGVNLLDEAQRKAFRQAIKAATDSAPVVHMSFASNPSSRFMAEIISWFRREVHPLTVVQIGLQPSIAAGCIVRTTNKYFDLSLRRHLVGQESKLIEQINGAPADG